MTRRDWRQQRIGGGRSTGRSECSFDCSLTPRVRSRPSSHQDRSVQAGSTRPSHRSRREWSGQATCAVGRPPGTPCASPGRSPLPAGRETRCHARTYRSSNDPWSCRQESSSSMRVARDCPPVAINRMPSSDELSYTFHVCASACRVRTGFSLHAHSVSERYPPARRDRRSTLGSGCAPTPTQGSAPTQRPGGIRNQRSVAAKSSARAIGSRACSRTRSRRAASQARAADRA